jgi:hypothetical protein
MKKLLVLFVLLFALCGQAQNVINADCTITLTVTAAGSSVAFDNRRIACTTWHMAYMSTGFTAVSMQLDYSADNAGVPAAWTVWPAADIAVGALPLTVTTEAQITGYKYHPWVRITLNSKTGTGTVRALAYGYKPWSGADSSSFGGLTPGSAANAFVAQTAAGSTTSYDASAYVPLNHTAQLNITITGKTLTACTYDVEGSLTGVAATFLSISGPQDCSAAATKTLIFHPVLRAVKYLRGTISTWTEGGAGAVPSVQLVYLGVR